MARSNTIVLQIAVLTMVAALCNAKPAREYSIFSLAKRFGFHQLLDDPTNEVTVARRSGICYCPNNADYCLSTCTCAPQDVTQVYGTRVLNVPCTAGYCSYCAPCCNAPACLAARFGCIACITPPNPDRPNCDANFGRPDARAIVGVGVDYQLYTRATDLSGSWTLVPGSGWVIAITGLNDGRILGVGKDNNQLWTLAADFSGSWTNVPNSGSVIGVTVKRDDGKIVGVGVDYQLYTRAADLSGSWTLVPGSGWVIAITGLEDGRILGVGKDNNQLWTLAADFSGTWTNVPNSGSVIGVALKIDDGRIIGIGQDNQLYIRAADLSGSWTLVPGSGRVIAVTVQRV